MPAVNASRPPINVRKMDLVMMTTKRIFPE
jgi:hypothetical protein